MYDSYMDISKIAYKAHLDSISISTATETLSYSISLEGTGIDNMKNKLIKLIKLVIRKINELWNKIKKFFEDRFSADKKVVEDLPNNAKKVEETLRNDDTSLDQVEALRRSEGLIIGTSGKALLNGDETEPKKGLFVTNIKITSLIPLEQTDVWKTVEGFMELLESTVEASRNRISNYSQIQQGEEVDVDKLFAENYSKSNCADKAEFIRKCILDIGVNPNSHEKVYYSKHKIYSDVPTIPDIMTYSKTVADTFKLTKLMSNTGRLKQEIIKNMQVVSDITNNLNGNETDKLTRFVADEQARFTKIMTEFSTILEIVRSYVKVKNDALNAIMRDYADKRRKTKPTTESSSSIFSYFNI